MSDNKIKHISEYSQAAYENKLIEEFEVENKKNNYRAAVKLFFILGGFCLLAAFATVVPMYTSKVLGLLLKGFFVQ